MDWLGWFATRNLHNFWSKKLLQDTKEYSTASHHHFSFLQSSTNHQNLGVLLQILFTNTDPPLHAWVCALQQPFAGNHLMKVTLMRWVFQKPQMVVKSPFHV